MRKWNWKIAKEQKQPKRYQWLKENYNKAVSEEEFVLAMRKLKKTSTATGKQKQKIYQPSRLRQNYKYLKDVYGFFR